MATRRTGKGSTLTLDGVQLGQITDLSGPSITKEQIEVTNFASPGSYREFIGGLRDAGQMDITLQMNPSSSTDNKIRSNFDLDTDETKAISINLAGSGTTLNFSGSVFAMNHSIPLNDVISMDCTLRISGPVTVSGAAWS